MGKILIYLLILITSNLTAIFCALVDKQLPKTPNRETGSYDYNKILQSSLLFYEAQRTGKLPADNRIKWRGDSMMEDIGDNGEDLTGGYFDAGDHVKFGFPLAFTVTTLSWGLIDFENAYLKAGELENTRKAIKWATDYMIKCHTKEIELYGQVGNGIEDHQYWGRPEDWPTDKKRPAYKITESKPGSDLVGETAAAFAASSLVFRKVNPIYSIELLKRAKQLYSFANEKRDNYSNSIEDAKIFDKGNGFGDELGWASVWLLRATYDNKYKTEFEKHLKEFKLDQQPLQFSWDNKTAGLITVMAQITDEKKYKRSVQQYCNWLRNDAPKTPKGLVFHAEIWGTLRHASNVAFICLQAAELDIDVAENRDFAKKQIGYALGDTGRSFVIGLGINPPTRPHHRAASCPDRDVMSVCNESMLWNPNPDPQTLTGALVGGPDENDNYEDKREDYIHNEVALDFNAGFQSAIAALAHITDKKLFF